MQRKQEKNRINSLKVTNNEEIFGKMKFIQKTIGAVPSPFDCWLTQRSIKTLHLRMPRHNENGMAIASFLNESGKIDKIYYPGLKDHPQHELAKVQQLDPNGDHGFGAMISIDLGSFEKAVKFTKNLNIFTLAESLGGVESLICHPATMTHASVDDETKNLLGIDDSLVRLSIGCEDTNDLISDILFALNKF